MRFFQVSVATISILLAGQAWAAESKPMSLETEKDKVSYTIGVDMGDNFRSQGIDVNPDVLAKGIADGQSGAEPLMTTEQMEETLLNFQRSLLEKKEKEIEQQAAENLKVGEAFLAENKKKPGVVTLPDGLQYKVIKEGTGEKPTDTDMVTVNYTGYLVDPNAENGMGEVFDSSVERGKPATFPVTGVIPGWTEALKLMKTGASWYVYIPAKLAYGENSTGPIGPNETLIFKIDLLKVTEGNAPKKADAAGQ